jgi:F-type H+-transporting ATPase subunit b
MLEKKCKTSDNQRILQEARWSVMHIKEAREMKEKMIADSKDEAQLKDKMIEAAKAAIEGEKCSMELKKLSFYFSNIAEKLLKEDYLIKKLKLN